MLTDERQHLIRAQLAADGRVLAGDLAARFRVSEDTIRRDLRELARGGECRRVYGGAVLPAPYAGPLGVRTEHAAEEKVRLAKTAVTLLAPRFSVFIDGGSTNIAIAKAIPHDLVLTVATNALAVASALAGHTLVDMVVLGGAFDREAGVCVGGDALKAIAGFCADMVFLGACGVDAGRGVTAFDSAEADVKRAMAANSTDIVIAVTLDKLATSAPFRVAEPEAIRHLVVGRAAPAAVLADFENGGSTIHLA